MPFQGAQELTLTVTIAAPASACDETITDFERSSDWSKSIGWVRVPTHGASGIDRPVELKLDVRVHAA